jgi:hypothetical protein
MLWAVCWSSAAQRGAGGNDRLRALRPGQHLPQRRRCARPGRYVFSGDGGWNLGVVSMAQRLSAKGAIVAGIDIRGYLAALEKSREKCVSPAVDLENLSHYLQAKLGIKKYLQPTLVGYSSGATLVYAALAESPDGLFKGALSIGFCPDLDLKKPVCKGTGIEATPRRDAKGVLKGVDFLPTKTLPGSWISLQGETDQVCPAPLTQKFIATVPGAEIVMLPKVGHGYAVEKNWVPQYESAYERITAAGGANAGDIACAGRRFAADRGAGERRREQSLARGLSLGRRRLGRSRPRRIRSARAARHPGRRLGFAQIFLVAAHAVGGVRRPRSRGSPLHGRMEQIQGAADRLFARCRHDALHGQSAAALVARDRRSDGAARHQRQRLVRIPRGQLARQCRAAVCRRLRNSRTGPAVPMSASTARKTTIRLFETDRPRRRGRQNGRRPPFRRQLRARSPPKSAKQRRGKSRCRPRRAKPISRSTFAATSRIFGRNWSSAVRSGTAVAE